MVDRIAGAQDARAVEQEQHADADHHEAQQDPADVRPGSPAAGGMSDG
nr:hypothetical protein [Baekduia soli]